MCLGLEGFRGSAVGLFSAAAHPNLQVLHGRGRRGLGLGFRV